MHYPSKLVAAEKSWWWCDGFTWTVDPRGTKRWDRRRKWMHREGSQRGSNVDPRGGLRPSHEEGRKGEVRVKIIRHFQNWWKEMSPQVEGAHHRPSRKKWVEIHTWFVTELQNTKDKLAREEGQTTFRDRMTANFSTAIMNIQAPRENAPWPDLYPEAGKTNPSHMGGLNNTANNLEFTGVRHPLCPTLTEDTFSSSKTRTLKQPQQVGGAETGLNKSGLASNEPQTLTTVQNYSRNEPHGIHV